MGFQLKNLCDLYVIRDLYSHMSTEEGITEA